MAELPDLSRSEGFDWDLANIQKNWRKHQVAFYECEEVFFHGPILFPNPKHSTAEVRYYALGRTMNRRLLMISFTMRGDKIRIISARAMNRKERRTYAQLKENP